MTAPTPQRCLAAADRMLRDAGELGAAAVTADGSGSRRGARRAEPELSHGWWPRACARLIRLALEGGIDAYWRRTRPVVAACRQGRAKHLLLRGRLGPGADVARRIAFAWSALSAAAHHHRYEPTPTAAELRRLHGEVSALLTHLTGRADPHR